MKWIIMLFFMVGFTNAHAMNLTQNFSFDGYLVDSSNNPIPGPANLVLKIYNPSGSCLLYEETQSNIPVDSTSGYFSIKIGSPVGSGQRDGNDPGNAWSKIFVNGTPFSTSTNCSSGYTPATGDGRALRVVVNSTTLTPDYAISAVPTATVAETLQGGSTIDGSLTVGGQNPIMLGDASNTHTIGFRAPSSLAVSTTYMLPMGDGSPGQFLSTNGTGILSWTNAGSAAIMSLNGLTLSSQSFANGFAGAAPSWTSGGSVHTLNIPMANGGGVTAGLISSTDWNNFNNKQGPIGFVPVNKAGDNMSGTLTLAAAPTGANDAATKAYVDAGMINSLPLSGGTLSGTVNFNSGINVTGPANFTSIMASSGSPGSPSLSLGGAGLGFFSPGASVVGISSSGVERIRVDSAGNVGIGTTTPTARLDVAGPVNINGPINVSGQVMLNATPALQVGPSGPGVVPMSVIRNFSNMTCSLSSISPGSTGTCAATVSAVNPSDIAAVICHPVTPPAQPIIHSCYINAPGQVIIAVQNVSGTVLATPPTLWNITEIKF